MSHQWMDKKYHISLPRLRYKEGEDSNDYLMPFNPKNKSHVKLYDRFGLYMSREMHYDFPLAWNNEEDEETKAYFLLHDGGWDYTSVLPIGIAVFSKAPYTNVDPNQWFLMFVWVHPFMRGQGALARVWSHFKQEFGDFELQRPISIGMKAFLERQKKDEARRVAKMDTQLDTQLETQSTKKEEENAIAGF